MHRMPPRTVLLGLLILCALALASAYIGEYLFKLYPCTLCYYQRYVFMLTLTIAAYGLVVKSETKKWGILYLCNFTFLINGIIAGYQVLVEQKIIELPSICKPQKIVAGNFESFKAGLAGASKAPIPCDMVSFELLGISMAGYNLIVCTGVVVLLTLYARQNLKS